MGARLRESIEERLCEAGLDPSASTIWVWEGVSMYLAEQDVRHTLELIARLSGPGSRVVCDVLSDPRRAGLDTVKVKVIDIFTEANQAAPGERVIAIGGSGHMAILKQLLAIDTRLEGVAVNPYF